MSSLMVSREYKTELRANKCCYLPLEWLVKAEDGAMEGAKLRLDSRGSIMDCSTALFVLPRNDIETLSMSKSVDS